MKIDDHFNQSVDMVRLDSGTFADGRAIWSGCKNRQLSEKLG